MIRLLVKFIEAFLATFYGDRLFSKFYILETLARIPYVSCTSVLNLCETMGWGRRKTNLLKVHTIQGWNKLHHVWIMESLSGNKYWLDRLVARTGAVIYYWILVFVYLISPSSAYSFMQWLEEYAYKTYDSFLKEYGDALAEQPAPKVANHYYRQTDLYKLNQWQNLYPPQHSRPEIETLYDLFLAVRNDETAHVKAMVACRQSNANGQLQESLQF